MESKMRPYDLHLMICTNTRGPTADGKPPKQSCGPLGAEFIRADLKDWLKAEITRRPKLNGRYRARVNGSGCLDFCAKGIVLALYPEGEFLLLLQNSANDLSAIKARLSKKLDEAELSAST
jgi:hypothetical protein